MIMQNRGVQERGYRGAAEMQSPKAQAGVPRCQAGGLEDAKLEE